MTFLFIGLNTNISINKNETMVANASEITLANNGSMRKNSTK